MVIAALECFKLGKQLTSLVRNRKLHVKMLIRALKSYNGYLELFSQWLLRYLDMYPEMKDHSLPYLMQNAEIIEKMKELLGKGPTAAFNNATEKGRLAVKKITENIDNMLPENKVCVMVEHQSASE